MVELSRGGARACDRAHGAQGTRPTGGFGEPAAGLEPEMGPLMAPKGADATKGTAPLGVDSSRGSCMVILMTMQILSLAHVKSHLSELVARVHSEHERVTVTVHGKPSAVLIATEDLESLEETIAILSDPDTRSRLAASEAELARGEGESAEKLAHAMNARRRLRA